MKFLIFAPSAELYKNNDMTNDGLITRLLKLEMDMRTVRNHADLVSELAAKCFRDIEELRDDYGPVIK